MRLLWAHPNQTSTRLNAHSRKDKARLEKLEELLDFVIINAIIDTDYHKFIHSLHRHVDTPVKLYEVISYYRGGISVEY